MARQRSPNYPSVDLGTAVEAVKSLYRREGQTSVAQEAAVRAWGFTTLSGSARTRLAALRQYDLVENVGQGGNVRITPRGLTLSVADPSSAEYKTALREAALAPDIFKELYETRQGASDDSLRHYLIVGRKFSADGATRLIESFRSTVELANLDDRGYDAGMETVNGNDAAPQGGTAAFTPPPTGSMRDRPVASNPGEAQFRWPLYEDVVAEVTFHGGAVTPDDVELLQEYLDTVKKARSRALRQAAPSPDATATDHENDRPGGA